MRISVWLLVLIVLGCLIYLNQVGIPQFVKKPLLEKLRSRGVDLEFSRLRWRFYRGLVAEDVRFGRVNTTNSPQFSAQQVHLHLSRESLKRLKFQVDGLSLRNARFIWPVEITNAPGRELAIENIQTELRLLPNDQWSLDNFTAEFGGASIRLVGSVTNASAVREWGVFRGHKGPKTSGSVWQRRLSRLADILEKIRFSQEPELFLDVHGDGSDPQSFLVRLMITTPGADTPWGKVTDGKLALRLYPKAANEPSHADMSLDAVSAETRWATVRNFQLSINLFSIGGESNLVRTSSSLSAEEVRSDYFSASNAAITANSVQSYTNPIPIVGEGTIACTAITSRWVTASSGSLRVSLVTPDRAALPAADPSWGPWQKIQPWFLAWQCAVTNVNSPKLVVAGLRAAGQWQAPTLTITNLESELYGGEVDGHATLNVASRECSGAAHLTADVKQAQALLTPGARRWLSQFDWNQPPDVTASASVILPSWTNRQPNWRLVQPLLVLDGGFNARSGGTFQKVPITSAHSHFSYSNMIWKLPDLVATRPEGKTTIALEASDRTKEFHFQVASALDPFILRPLFPTNAARVFNLFKLGGPPLIEAEIWGQWRAHERTGFRGSLVATNFSLRDVHIDQALAKVWYTNRLLTIISPSAKRGDEHADADGLTIDFNEQKLYLTNAVGAADPAAVVHMIGPHVERVMKPYHFDRPPSATVTGVVPLKHAQDADLYFHLSGGPFSWWKVHVPAISGRIHWVGDRLSLTDVAGTFYGGSAKGSATFEFASPYGTSYHFALFATNALLNPLMTDLIGKPSNLEGRLSGNIAIVRANSDNPNLMTGSGNLELHDGYIWSIPLFGVFSPALDSIAPGLGTSKATDGSGTFILTNGLVQSDDLELRSPAMRLQYRGAVSLDGTLNARVEAVLLRDMWVLGPLVSAVFWPVTKLFEYKVSGPLAHPKIEPLYLVPKVLFAPFHPFKSMKGLLESDERPPPPPSGAEK